VTYARWIYRDAGRLEPYRGLAAAVPSKLGESPGTLFLPAAAAVGTWSAGELLAAGRRLSGLGPDGCVSLVTRAALPTSCPNV
jgi:hypothetical protein